MIALWHPSHHFIYSQVLDKVFSKKGTAEIVWFKCNVIIQ